MTTNQLKTKADNWLKAFNWATIIAIAWILVSVFLPNQFSVVYSAVYFLCVAAVILVGFRTKKWNDTYCDQRDKEYWQNKKDEVLKRLEGKPNV